MLVLNILYHTPWMEIVEQTLEHVGSNPGSESLEGVLKQGPTKKDVHTIPYLFPAATVWLYNHASGRHVPLQTGSAVYYIGLYDTRETFRHSDPWTVGKTRTSLPSQGRSGVLPISSTSILLLGPIYGRSHHCIYVHLGSPDPIRMR